MALGLIVNEYLGRDFESDDDIVRKLLRVMLKISHLDNTHIDKPLVV
jgi:hypothetical protein